MPGRGGSGFSVTGLTHHGGDTSGGGRSGQQNDLVGLARHRAARPLGRAHARRRYASAVPGSCATTRGRLVVRRRQARPCRSSASRPGAASTATPAKLVTRVHASRTSARPPTTRAATSRRTSRTASSGSVLYPSQGLVLFCVPDSGRRARRRCAPTTTDIAEFCAEDPRRLKGIAHGQRRRSGRRRRPSSPAAASSAWSARLITVLPPAWLPFRRPRPTTPLWAAAQDLADAAQPARRHRPRPTRGAATGGVPARREAACRRRCSCIQDTRSAGRSPT